MVKHVIYAIALVSGSAVAGTAEPYQACFEAAATHQRVPKQVLLAIAEQESSFRPKAINRANRNGSVDYGIMQVNSSWLPKLKKFGIAKPSDLLDACTNIHVGAWIFAEGIAKHGWNWRGIGAYNAAKDHLRFRYAEKILVRWRRIAMEEAIRGSRS